MSDFFVELKSRFDLVSIVSQHVELTQRNKDWWGKCPFHEESTASFKVNPNLQTFYCFGCHAKGDVITFTEKIFNITRKEAIKRLAGEAGMKTSPKIEQGRKQNTVKQSLYKVMQVAVLVYHKTLLDRPEGEKGRQYLLSRGISKNVWKKYKLGVAPDPKGPAGWRYLVNQISEVNRKFAVDAGLVVKKNSGSSRVYDRFRNRVVIPIINHTGYPVAFTGRTLDPKQPKYINSPESDIFKKKKILLGFYNHLPEIQKQQKVFVVEGGFDLLGLAEHGILNCVAPMGTAITSEHIKNISQRVPRATLILSNDGDKAGVASIYRSAPLILSSQHDSVVLQLPENHDPHSYLQTYGRKAFDSIANEAISLIDFMAESLKKHDQKAVHKLEGEIKKLFDSCSTALQKEQLVTALGRVLGVGVSTIAHIAGINAVEQKSIDSQDKNQGSQKIIRQTQHSRRVAAFFLHYPEKYFLLKKYDFYSMCEDALSRFILKGLEENRGDLAFCFSSSWCKQIEQLFSSNSIETKLLEASGDKEEEALLEWYNNQVKQRERREKGNNLVNCLLQKKMPV